MCEPDNIEILKELTPQLAGLVVYRNNNFVEYDVECGTTLGFGIFNIPEVAVQRAFCSYGTEFKRHSHTNAVEVLVPYRGSFKAYLEERDGIREIVVAVGSCVYFLPGVPHWIDVLEDTWMIAVVVPALEGYPHGE